MHRNRLSATVVVALLVSLLAACGASSDDKKATTDADAITMSDPWVKASQGMMTGTFGTLKNSSDSDITIASITSPAAGKVEMHETVADTNGQMSMRKIEGGFVIPAKGEFALEVGGNHIMLLDLTGPITPGDEVEITIEFEDGSTMTYTAMAKETAAGNENYNGSTQSTPTTGMSMN